MKTSHRGVALIKQFEGLELEAYQCIAKRWTIGYGHTGDDVMPGLVITEAAAEDLLREDLVSRERLLSGWALRNKVTLKQNEFDALISFIYNVGFDGFQTQSTTARLLRGGDRVGAGRRHDALA